MSQQVPSLSDAPQGVDGVIDSPEIYNNKNAMITQAYRAAAGDGMMGGNGGVGNKYRVTFPDDPAYTPIWTQNTSGSNLIPGQILGVTSPGVPTPNNTATDNRTINFFTNPNLVGIVPVIPASFNNFVVALGTIPNNQWGWCCVQGYCTAYVKIQNTGDLYCDVTNNDYTQLTSGPDGAALIVYPLGSGTGKQLCVIQIGAGIYQGATFMCGAKQNGGVSGTNKTVTCTYTYDLYPLGTSSGTKYNPSVITPMNWRFGVTQYTAGTIAMCYRDTSAVIQIANVIDEKPNSASC